MKKTYKKINKSQEDARKNRKIQERVTQIMLQASHCGTFVAHLAPPRSAWVSLGTTLGRPGAKTLQKCPRYNFLGYLLGEHFGSMLGPDFHLGSLQNLMKQVRAFLLPLPCCRPACLAPLFPSFIEARRIGKSVCRGLSYCTKTSRPGKRI